MRAQEFLIEAADNSNYSLENARISHPEDMVIAMGSAGAKTAIATIKQMATNPETISIKPDGKPAIVWGRDEQGFGMADKHMFAKGIIPRNPQQLAQVYSERKGGSREELTAMMTALWPQFEASLSSGFKGWMFGDLLYSQRPGVQNNNFVFQPNTVVYTVPVASDLGQQIAKSTSGIVAHSYFAAPGQPGKHISQLRGINPNGPLLVITDQFAAPPRVKIPPDLKSLESFVNSNGALIDKLLDKGTLSAGKISSFPQIFQKYVNAKVKSRDFGNFGSDFIEWMANAKVSLNMQKNIAAHLQNNASGYKVFCQAFLGIMKVKDHIVALLDKYPAPLQGSIKGEPGQEGYLIHTGAGPVKAVDRQKFSAANFEH
jgi:hypothetical protein